MDADPSVLRGFCPGILIPAFTQWPRKSSGTTDSTVATLSKYADAASLERGIRFIRSHLRVENFVNDSSSEQKIASALDAFLESPGFAAILTHEYELERPEVRTCLRTIARHYFEKSIKSR